MPNQKRLPSGGEFSPGQIGLHDVLSIVAGGGTRKHLVEEIRKRYFGSSCTGYSGDERVIQQSKRAGNVLIGMQTYGLISGTNLTELGSKLLALEPAEAGVVLALHILANLGGFEIVDAIRALQSRGADINKGSLAEELERRGYVVPRATTHHLILIKWLREAGIFSSPRGYEIDEEALRRVSGLASSDVSAAYDLTSEQRDFLTAAAAMGDGGDRSLSVGDVLDQASLLLGTRFRQDQVTRTIVAPLEAADWLSAERGSRGRGAKSGTITLTPKALAAFADNCNAFAIAREDATSRALLRMPLRDILDRMGSTDTHQKGMALEHLAARLCDFLRLRVKKWRLRSADTGGAEVDVIAEGSHLMFSRWQIQCKNTATTDLHDAAKEVGLATVLHSQVIVLITTGRATHDCRTYAERVAKETVHQFIIIDRDDLNTISSAASPANALVDFLNRVAKATLELKSRQLESL